MGTSDDHRDERRPGWPASLQLVALPARAGLVVGDLWLVRLQEVSREAYIEEYRQIKERGFLAVMWPKLVAFLVLMVLGVAFVRWYG